MRAVLQSLDTEPGPVFVPTIPRRVSALARMIVGPADARRRREADVPEGLDRLRCGSLETFLAGVSYRRECVRGEGEWQPSGLPLSRGA